MLLICAKFVCCKQRKKIGWEGSVWDENASPANIFNGVDVMRCLSLQCHCCCHPYAQSLVAVQLMPGCYFWNNSASGRATGITDGMMMESNPIAAGGSTREPMGPPPGTKPHGYGLEPSRPPPSMSGVAGRRSGGAQEGLLSFQPHHEQGGSIDL